MEQLMELLEVFIPSNVCVCGAHALSHIYKYIFIFIFYKYVLTERFIYFTNLCLEMLRICKIFSMYIKYIKIDKISSISICV